MYMIKLFHDFTRKLEVKCILYQKAHVLFLGAVRR